MKKALILLLFTLLAINLANIPTQAQSESCAAVFEAALEAVDTLCDSAERNEACYGHNTLSATAYADTAFTFETPGDMTQVNNIQTIELSPLNIEEETWGVAVMQLQANIPNTLPGSNVTTIMFGDVTINNAVEPIVEETMIATAGVNVRSRPTTNADNIVASLTNGQAVTATGKLADGSWIRITFMYDENTSIDGWVSADFLNGDKSLLNTVEADAALYTPMQAFYLQTGVGQGACAEIPGDGILIQTPEGVGQITININEVEITLGSTIYVQATENEMKVYTLEGLVSIRANDISQRIPPGAVSIIELDANGTASSTPQYPIPYDTAAVQLLNPILNTMPQVITAPVALQPEQVQAAVQEAEQEAAVAGGSAADNGLYEFVLIETDCEYDAVSSFQERFSFTNNGDSVESSGDFWTANWLPLTIIDTGVFTTQSVGGLPVGTRTYTILSSNRISMRWDTGTFEGWKWPACSSIYTGTWISD